MALGGGQKLSEKAVATALLLNYKKSESLRKAISSIRKQDADVEIILWDNSGEVNSFDCDTYISASRNYHCKPRFLVAALAASEYIFTLDDDTMLANCSVIRKYVEFMQTFSCKDNIMLAGDACYEQALTKPCDIQSPSGDWEEVLYGKGRFLFFHKSYLGNVRISFVDLVDSRSRSLYSGFTSLSEAECLVGVDDISFQRHARQIFRPKYPYLSLIDQPTALTGCWNTPGFDNARDWFLRVSITGKRAKTNWLEILSARYGETFTICPLIINSSANGSESTATEIHSEYTCSIEASELPRSNGSNSNNLIYEMSEHKAASFYLAGKAVTYEAWNAKILNDRNSLAVPILKYPSNSTMSTLYSLYQLMRFCGLPEAIVLATSHDRKEEQELAANSFAGQCGYTVLLGRSETILIKS